MGESLFTGGRQLLGLSDTEASPELQNRARPFFRLWFIAHVCYLDMHGHRRAICIQMALEANCTERSRRVGRALRASLAAGKRASKPALEHLSEQLQQQQHSLWAACDLYRKPF